MVPGNACKGNFLSSSLSIVGWNILYLGLSSAQRNTKTLIEPSLTRSFKNITGMVHLFIPRQALIQSLENFIVIQQPTDYNNGFFPGEDQLFNKFVQ